MKAIILLSFALLLSAFDNVTAAKIFDRIFHAMISKEQVKVYTGSETYQEVVSQAPSLYLTKECDEADVVLISELDEMPQRCSDKVAFTTSYPVFKATQSVVGAFYWERGQITIRFSRSRLSRYHLSLPGSFDKYISEEW